MNNFKLEYRSLLDEEKLIIFGKAINKFNTLPILKASSAENYYEMYRRLYNNEEVLIPEFINEEEPIRLYIFHEHFSSSTYFKPIKETTTAIPINYASNVYAKYSINSVLTPAISNMTSLFYSTEQPASHRLYQNVNIDYSSIIDTIKSGMFLNLYHGKVISAVSFKAMLKSVNCFDAYRIKNVGNLPKEELEQLYNNITFNLPSSIIKKFITEPVKLPDKFVSSTVDYLLYTKSAVQGLAASFDTSTLSNNCIVIAPDFINLSGFAYTNNTSYVLFGNGPKSPLGQNKASNFTNALDNILTQGIVKNNTSLSDLFSFNTSEHGYYGATANGSFVFLNEDNMEINETLLNCGIQEYVELDKEFINSLKQIYLDRADAVVSTTFKEKFKKEEFAIKRESVLSGLASVNKRYIPLKNGDKKLLVMTKTSMAKEAARKMSITRKITNAVEPVIDMAIRLFAMRDFELGYADNASAFPTTTARAFNSTYTDSYNKIITEHPEYKTWFDLRKEEFKKQSSNGVAKTAASVISDLYADVVYTGTPFWCFFQSVNGYRNTFCHITQRQQETLIFTYITSLMIEAFSGYLDYNKFSGYFSPSSGLLNLYNLTNTLYHKGDYAEFRPELAYLKQEGHYHRGSGKQLHYIYSNNFIGVDQAQSDEIERNRNLDYISLSNCYIPANSAFTFGQDVLDSFITLKKAKTFSDYFIWFKSVRPELDNIISSKLKDDYFIMETTKIFLEQSELLFEELVKVELPYIPKEEVKKRGRKPKATTAAVSEEIVDESETEELLEGEENGGSLTVQSAIGAGSTESINEQS